MEVQVLLESSVFTTWCWIITVIFWISLILAIREHFSGKSYNPVFAIIAIIAYIILIINSFCSPAWSFLNSEISLPELHNLLQKVYVAPPVVVLSMDCYHNEVRKYYDKLPNGTYVQKEEIKKVHTHSASGAISFVSYKDVSEPFYLDVTQVSYKKSFIRLHLSYSLINHPDGTADDIARQIDEFKRNHNRDTFCNFSQQTDLRDFKEYALIRKSSKGADYVGKGWYVLFSLLSVTELHKQYLGEISQDMEYDVKKIVSTRTNELYLNRTLPPIRIHSDDYHTDL